MTNIKQDESFTISSIKQDHIVFGGLISAAEAWDKENFRHYTSIARDSLSTIYSGINFESNQNIIANIGYDELINFINLILDNNTENKEILITLSNIEKNSRYIIFSKILTDNVKKNNYSSKTENTYVTERKISVFTSIYDLKTLHNVWSGNITTVMSNSNTNTHQHDSNFLGDLLTTFVEDVIYGDYPKPPDIESLINKSFSDIGDNITNRPCNELGYLNCIKRSISRF
ncbi:MAG: hypothetical protein ACN4GM_04945 [Gammaproteobacteria bacterium]